METGKHIEYRRVSGGWDGCLRKGLGSCFAICEMMYNGPKADKQLLGYRLCREFTNYQDNEATWYVPCKDEPIFDMYEDAIKAYDAEDSLL